ncbi:MAG: hypothetical protein LBI27_08335 [Clostridiales bacterium]|jgi:hypothetical protein|nr:hypothetical protein [Clostridiales bacterium]
MDEKLVAIVKTLLPDGSDVTKIYKDATGEIKVDIVLPGGAGSMTCSLKKNHAGSLYIE